VLFKTFLGTSRRFDPSALQDTMPRRHICVDVPRAGALAQHLGAAAEFCA
jgi:hypothetical protein